MSLLHSSYVARASSHVSAISMRPRGAYVHIEGLVSRGRDSHLPSVFLLLQYVSDPPVA